MKKIVLVIISLLLMVGLFVGCTKSEEVEVQVNVSENVSVPVADVPVPAEEKPVACPVDAKVCPDGSSVGRIAPDCEFAVCPEVVVEPIPTVDQPAVSINKIHLVEVINETFSPSTLTIKIGDTVTWKNMRDGYYGKVMIVGSRECRTIRSGILEKGQTFSYTFNQTDSCIITDGFIIHTKPQTVNVVE